MSTLSLQTAPIELFRGIMKRVIQMKSTGTTLPLSDAALPFEFSLIKNVVFCGHCFNFNASQISSLKTRLEEHFSYLRVQK
jgi:hypothetical protein